MHDDIQQEAIGLFNEVGEGFTLDQLQARTGLSRATLYRRIGSKEALLKRLSDENLIRLDDSSGMDARVFAAARNIIAQYGFLACTMEQIAKEAGVGVATLYRHFGDKDNLLGRFAVNMAPKPVVRQTSEHREPDFDRDLRQMIEIGLRFGQQNQEIARIIFSMKPAERKYLEAQRHDSATSFSRFVRYLRRYQEAGVLRDDVSADDLAMNLNGLLLQYSAFGPAYLDRQLDFERDTNAILKMFMQSARKAR
ncbi:MAG: TetR family transcriptional regulator [Hyphomicrobiales bacterium]|nr:TetR family transcriptional regulator [Hyphomicrobiales bacterium]